MAYTYAYSGNGTPSTVIRSGGSAPDLEFPQVGGNADYEAWVQFTALGGSTDDAPVVTLDDEKDVAKATAAAMAQDSSRALTAALPRDALTSALRFQEAVLLDQIDQVDPVLTAYTPATPLLDAEVAADLWDDLDAARDGVLAELADLTSDLAAITASLATTNDAIDASADSAAIAVALAAFASSLVP